MSCKRIKNDHNMVIFSSKIFCTQSVCSLRALLKFIPMFQSLYNVEIIFFEPEERSITELVVS